MFSKSESLVNQDSILSRLGNVRGTEPVRRNDEKREVLKGGTEESIELGYPDMRFGIRLACLALVVTLLGLATTASAQLPPNTLWHVIDSLCVPGKKAGTEPLPCLDVDLGQGIAVLAADATHLLVTPTIRISGIESPEILASDAPNYWAYAWHLRGNVEGAIGRQMSRDNFAMAINSVRGRSQDQLHIHLGCIRPDVRAALQIYESNIGPKWSKLPFAVVGRKYRIMRLEEEELGAADPFKLLASGIPGATDSMGNWTIVVAGAHSRNGGNGFYILASDSAPSGEQLLDFKCSAAAVRSN